MFEQEIWEDIKNYEGIYQISNCGRIKRLSYSIIKSNGKKQSWGEKILKPTKDSSGYYGIKTGTRPIGKSQTLRIHRLVAEHFISNPNNYPCVNHKDGNKLNNHVDNLEWCTYSYNLKHAFSTGLRKDIRRINQYDKQGNFIRSYESAREAERIGGFRNQNIAHCCKGIEKSHYGYIWKYADDNN